MIKPQDLEEMDQQIETLEKETFWPYIADIIRRKCKKYNNQWIESNQIIEFLLEDSATGDILETDYIAKVREVGKSTKHHTKTIEEWTKNIVAYFSATYTLCRKRAKKGNFKVYYEEFDRPENGKCQYRLRNQFLPPNTPALSPPRTNTISFLEMKERTRDKAESQLEIGRFGEELVAIFLKLRVDAGYIEDFEWTSDTHAMSPYDFGIEENDGTLTLIDVKSTPLSFERLFYMSRAEIETGFMRGKEYKYCIYRVYDLDMDKKTGKMRISDNLKSEDYANYFDFLEDVPDGIYIDNVKINPSKLYFNPEVSILEK